MLFIFYCICPKHSNFTYLIFILKSVKSIIYLFSNFILQHYIYYYIFKCLLTKYCDIHLSRASKSVPIKGSKLQSHALTVALNRNTNRVNFGYMLYTFKKSTTEIMSEF